MCQILRTCIRFYTDGDGVWLCCSMFTVVLIIGLCDEFVLCQDIVAVAVMLVDADVVKCKLPTNHCAHVASFIANV